MGEFLQALELTRPWGLLCLLILPLVYWLHRDPARTLFTDRLEIWLRALARVPRARRRRPTLRLILSLLLFALLSLAIAGVQQAAKAGYKRLFIVVDQSASMTATDHGVAAGVTNSRIESARQLANQELAALPDWIPAQVLGINGQVLKKRVEFPQGLDARDRKLSESLFASHSGHARLELASKLAFRDPQACVLLYSDGAGPSSWPTIRENLYFRALGDTQAKSSTAILAARLSDPWPGPQLELDLVLDLPQPDPSRGGATIRILDGRRKLIRTETLALEASEDGHVHRRLLLPRGDDGRVIIELLPPDSFLADEHIEIRAPPPWSFQLRALPKSDERLGVLADFLNTALSAGKTAGSTTEARARGELQLVNGGSLAGWPEDGVLRILFGTRFSTSRNTQGLEGRLDWQRTHDLLRGLDLSTLRSKRRVLFGSVEPADSETLAWVSGEALILLSKQHSFLWLGVSLADSNLSTQPFLPLLCIRALAALLPSAGKATLTALLDPVESDIAATKPLPRADTPRFYRPPRAYWPWLLAAAMCLLLLRAVLFPTALFPSSSI